MFALDVHVPERLMYLAAYLMEWVHRFGGPRPKMTRLEVHNLTSSFTFRTDRARRELGYRPLVQREEGLRACLPYYRDLLCSLRRERGAPGHPSRSREARGARGAAPR